MLQSEYQKLFIMRQPENVPIFSKALLAAALTGIVATIINGVYDIIFRGITRYLPATEFNFLSIPLVTMILFIILGLLFFVFMKFMNKSAFTIALIIIVIVCFCITAFLHDKTEPAFYGNHGLIAGFIIIAGILSLTLLPYLYNHPKIYI